MIRLDAPKPASFCDRHAPRFPPRGLAGPLGLTLPGYLRAKEAAGAKDSDVNCIMLFLLGGPTHIDTWDMKPKAPAEVRGPFQPIETKATGIQISEIFPKMAKHADKFSLIRSVYHTATAVHDTGHQMMQTGRLFTGGIEHPHVGCSLGYLKGGRGEVPAHVLLPRPMGRTGGNLPHGQTAGYLGKNYDPFVLNADPSVPNFKVPDLLPPDYISAVRAERRQKLRDGRRWVAGSVREQRGRQAARRQLQPGLSPDVEPEGPRGVRHREGAGPRCAIAMAARASASAA